jgi:hypothetical protein
MAAMMTMPPTMTSRDAHRSTLIRRPARARETSRGRAGDAGPLALFSVTAPAMAIYWILFSSSFAMEAGSGK